MLPDERKYAKMARVDWRIISSGYDRSLFTRLDLALKRQIITHQIRSIKPFTQAWKRNSRGFFSKKEKVHLWPGLLNPWVNAAMGSDLWCRNNYTRTFMGSHRRSFKQTLRPLGSILDLLWTACKHQQGGVLYAGSVARYFQCLSRRFIGIWWIARLILWNETIPHIW